MPSAKVSDGCLHNIPELSCEKNDENKKKDIELFKKLDERRQKLEDLLLQKLEELKKFCICEGELTGIMPIEIYKTLMPGEIEPKIKRRIGTAFKFSQQVLYCSNDQISQLETDIELNRKIVIAAERLAKDKSANKSVRKKRRKDWQAAIQRLKSLEKKLYKLRISNSKPDVSVNFENLISSNNSTSGFSLNNLKGWSNFSNYTLKKSTKSCPATPRGSIPDLSLIDISCNKSVEKNNRVDSVNLIKKTNESLMKSLPCSQSHLIQTNSATCLSTENLPPTIPNRRTLESTISVSSMSNSLQKSSQNLIDLNKSHSNDFPMYANVGYTSSVPYKSAYRQSNFPTIQDSKLINASNKCLNKNKSSAFSTSFTVEKPINENNVSDYSSNDFSKQVSILNIPHKLQQQRCSSSSQSSAGSISIGSIASTASSSGYHSSSRHIDPLYCTLLDNRFIDFKQPLSSIPNSFSTTSLDRRALKGSLSQSALMNNIENQKSLYNNRFKRENNLLITTFPVKNYYSPFELNNYNKYRSNSLARSGEQPSTNMSGLKKSSVSASGLPSFLSNMLNNSNQYRNHLKLRNNLPILETDPRLDALLASIQNSNHSKSIKSNLEIPNSTDSSLECNNVQNLLIVKKNDELIKCKTATSV